MAKSVTEIQKEIQELGPIEKRELLGLLVEDLNHSEDGSLDQVWLHEAQNRFKELKQGNVEGIPASQVFAKVESRLR